jgi:c-di-GMP-binding flagellar brake protein YcgR
LRLKIGERLDVRVENGRVYRSRLDDAHSWYLILDPPFYKGIPVIFHQNQQVTLSFYRESGRFSVDALMRRFRQTGNLRQLVFEPYGEPRRDPLRSTYRVPTDINALIRQDQGAAFTPIPAAAPPWEEIEPEDGDERTTLMDVSEGGLSFRTFSRWSMGDKLFVRAYFEFPEPGSPPVDFHAEVRRVQMLDAERELFQVGARYVEIEEEIRRYVSRYVFIRQQKRLKQQRLVEGDRE